MSSISKHLTQYLIKLNQLEIFNENLRQTMCTNPFFQTISVFERFDKFRKGHLTPSDFSEFMLENGIYPSDLELYLIFKDFDVDKVGLVTIERFEE